MAKRLTVFYSWQSDSPSNANRNYIERALQDSLKRLNYDASIEAAMRGTTIEIDKDTKGISGSPPITDTILRKIQDCSVFVADLTFVGQSKEGLKNASGKSRLFPNPNVLIEYGYALHCHSHHRMIGIMNTAFGKPNAESLPFDLRHLRWPITYNSAKDSDATKRDEFEKLVTCLSDAIKLILSSHPERSAAAQEFAPHKPTKGPAIFSDVSEELFTDRSSKFDIPIGGTAYLRLYPKVAVPPIESELEAREMASSAGLRPLGRINGWGFDRNMFGAIAFESPENGKLFHFTQLFLTREVWGVDAESLNAERTRPWLANENRPYIANGHLEDCYISALTNYLMFAQNQLKLPLPIQIEAGLAGIKDYPISLNAYTIGGKSLRDSISWKTDIDSYQRAAVEILGPFFDKIWDNCGIKRTAERQVELIRRHSVRP